MGNIRGTWAVKDWAKFGEVKKITPSWNDRFLKGHVPFIGGGFHPTQVD